MNRREFLKGCGLSLAVGLTPLGAIALRAAEPAADFRPNLWLTITPGDRVLCWINKSEMGQGVYTSLPMILADELGASLRQVEVRPAPALPGYGDPEMGGMLLTGGSTSVRHMYACLRTAGAAAREMLVAAAAKLWKEPAAGIRCREGRVEGRGHAVSFGEMARHARRERPPARPALKDPREFVYIGTPVPRLDIPEKVAGKAQFGIDVCLPGLAYAVFLRPPRFGARPKAVDTRAAKALPGVIAVPTLSQGVAVIAETIGAAFRGREALRVEWEGGEEKLSSASAEAALVDALQGEGIVAREEGRPRELWASGSRRLERTYRLPFLAHGTLEPMNATAWVKDGGVRDMDRDAVPHGGGSGGRPDLRPSRVACRRPYPISGRRVRKAVGPRFRRRRGRGRESGRAPGQGALFAGRGLRCRVLPAGEREPGAGGPRRAGDALGLDPPDRGSLRLRQVLPGADEERHRSGGGRRVDNS